MAPQVQSIPFVPAASHNQMEKVENLLEDALANGARLVAGGNRVEGEKGLFFEPTILADINPRCKLWTEEAFGPLMLIIPASDDKEAIDIANATPFGLASSVSCSDLSKFVYSRQLSNIQEEGGARCFSN